MVAPSFEVKQKVLQLVVQRIVVEDHRITIEHVVPSGPIRWQPEHHAPAGPTWRIARGASPCTTHDYRVALGATHAPSAYEPRQAPPLAPADARGRVSGSRAHA